MKKVIAVIDGFNYYHRIDDYYKKSGISLKWLNYHSLVNSRLYRTQEKLEAIYFFTAIQERKPFESQKRHEIYLSALESVGIKVIRGRFNYPPVTCRNCNFTYRQPKEKMTDVSIATKLVEGAFTDEYDVCFLLTADNDLVPAIQCVKKNRPHKRIITFLPPGAMYHEDLKKHCHDLKKIRFTSLKQHLFPSEIEHKGQKICSPYAEYLSPPFPSK